MPASAAFTAPRPGVSSRTGIAPPLGPLNSWADFSPYCLGFIRAKRHFIVSTEARSLNMFPVGPVPGVLRIVHFHPIIGPVVGHFLDVIEAKIGADFPRNFVLC